MLAEDGPDAAAQPFRTIVRHDNGGHARVSSHSVLQEGLPLGAAFRRFEGADGMLGLLDDHCKRIEVH